MSKYEKGIDVLCVFVEGTPPIPRKFKIKYKEGTIKLVEIEQVRFVEEKYKNGISNHHFIYHCTSESNEVLINYELKYFVQDMRWELIINNS